MIAIARVVTDASPDQISDYAIRALRVGASIALLSTAVVFAWEPSSVIGSATDRVADDHLYIIRSAIDETATEYMYLRRASEIYPPRHSPFNDVIKSDWWRFKPSY